MAVDSRLTTHRIKHLEEAVFEIKGKASRPDLCLVKGCRNPGHPEKMSLCHRHYQARWRFKSRKPSAFATLRDHCIARGILFTISFDYFCGLCDSMGYFENTGLNGESLSLDRVDPVKGYIPGNVRVVTRSANSAKSNRERYLPEHVQEMLDRKRRQLQANLDEMDRRMNPHLYDGRDPF